MAVAQVLITDDTGSYTATFSGDSTDTTVAGYILDYTPKTPEKEHIELATVTEDGGELPISSYKNPVETARFQFRGTMSQIRFVINRLNRLFRQAEYRQRAKVGSRVWIEFRPDSTENYYRSEMLSGYAELEDDSMSSQYAAGVLILKLTWTRRYYWEDTSETQIALTNGNGSNVTTPLTIYNHDDGDTGHDDYVQIAAASVNGDLPAPAKLLLTNGAASNPATHIFVGLNTRSSASNFIHIIEGENYVGAYTGSSKTTGAGTGYSNGGYATIQVPTTDADLCSFALPNDFTQYNGNFFRVLGSIKVNSLSGQVRLRASVSASFQSYRLASTPDTYIGAPDRFQDLGVIQIPPTPNIVLDSSLSNATYAPVFVLSGQGIGVTNSLEIDFIALIPLDGWREYRSVNSRTLNASGSLTDDPYTGALYDKNGALLETNHVVTGGELMLEPQTTQRLYFLWLNNAVDITVGDSMTVKAYYRARRLFL